jgi:hypothetical protein
MIAVVIVNSFRFVMVVGRLRQWSGELPVSRRQERKDRTPDCARRALPVAGVAACAAQRVYAESYFMRS